MLEGHFVGLALDPDFAKINMPVYYVWKSVRSHTAPLFFTIAGLVITYLLMRENTGEFFRNQRVKKGVLRSIKLLFWGYVLHLDLHYLIKGYFSPFFFSFHVLQCLAFVLLIIVLLYALYLMLRVVPMTLLLALGGMFSFMLPTTLDTIDPDSVWPFFQDALGITEEGARFHSAFPIFPWVGYSLFGGAIGAFMRSRPKVVEQRSFGIYLILIGILLHIVPYGVLWVLEFGLVPMGMTSFVDQHYEFSRLGRLIAVIGIIALVLEYRKEIAAYCKERLAFFFSNWFQASFLLLAILLMTGTLGQLQLGLGLTLTGLGHILLFLAIGLLAARFVPWNFDLFLKIGQYTLPVYVVHVIVLYSGIFGFGLNHYIRYSMEPWTAICAAAVFIVAFVYLVKYIEYFQLSYYLKKREERRSTHEDQTN